ncbi:MAG: gamma-glutamylcyclotransferase family protein [Siphonobacter sp.]
MDYLFVYGTLRRNAEMHKVLQHQAEWISEATIGGKLYLIDWYPGLIKGTKQSERVKGEVYRLQNTDRVLFELDQYEGYYPYDEAHSDYLRRLETVELTTGEQVKAWVYLYNLPTLGLPLITSGDFLNR